VGPQLGILLVKPLQGGVEQQGQDVKGGEEGGQMLLTMAEVVLQVVALGFEGVVVFILNLPSGPSGSNNLSDGVIAEGL
jgi:hypothetical protein